MPGPQSSTRVLSPSVPSNLSEDELLALANFDHLRVLEHAAEVKMLKGGEAALTSAATLNFEYALKVYEQFADRSWAKDVYRNVFTKFGPSVSMEALPKLVQVDPDLVIRTFHPQGHMLGAWDFVQWNEALRDAHRETTEKAVRAFERSGDWRLQSYAILIRGANEDRRTRTYQVEEVEERLRRMWHLLKKDRLFSADEAVRLYKDPVLYYTKMLSLPETAFKDTKNRDELLREFSEKAIYEISLYHDPARVEAVLKSARLDSKDIATLVASGKAELREASFRAIMRYLSSRMSQDNLTPSQLFEEIVPETGRRFFKALSRFNGLSSFFASAKHEERSSTVSHLTTGLSAAENPILEAGVLAQILGDSIPLETRNQFEASIFKAFSDAKMHQDFKGLAVYGLLAAEATKTSPTTRSELVGIGSRYAKALPDLRIFALDPLFENNPLIQRHVFISDDDGKQSFSNFLSRSAASGDWTIEKKAHYVHLVSKIGTRKIEIYANDPFSPLDSNEVVSNVLQDKRLTPRAFVFRGHINHFSQWMRYLSSEAELIVVGGCDSESYIDEIIERAPFAHIITTRDIGTMRVNDPMLSLLNHEMLTTKGDIVWKNFWEKIRPHFRATKEFDSYIRPDQNSVAHFSRAYRALIENPIL